MRRALSEPSIGSMTTRAPSPSSPKRTSPRASVAHLRTAEPEPNPGTPGREAEEVPGIDSVVVHDDGPLLLLGAAGTGKSEALAARLARLAAEGTGPEQALLIASTEA